VIALGVVLIAALLALQLYLAARFQRLVNPALAAATVIAIAFVAVTAVRFNAESGHLQVAKQDAFDSIQALSLARAVSYDANADESRYLVDPGRAAQYQQAFLSKSQQIANVGPVSISGYDAALAADIKAYQGDNSVVRFGGYLGAAVGYDTGTAPSQSDGAFNQYDAALSSVIAVNSRAFAAAVADGEDGAAAWELGLPAVGLVLLAALTFAAVRPRLAEYR
jgi:hypothetical protein